MNKKVLLGLSGLMALSLAACSGGAKTETTKAEETKAEETTKAGESKAEETTKADAKTDDKSGKTLKLSGLDGG